MVNEHPAIDGFESLEALMKYAEDTGGPLKDFIDKDALLWWLWSDNAKLRRQVGDMRTDEAKACAAMADARGVIAKLRKLEGSDDHPEYKCQRCGGRNIVWYAENAVWNKVVRERWHILCPLCFVELDEQAGVKPTSCSWLLVDGAENDGVWQERKAARDRLAAKDAENADVKQAIADAKCAVAESRVLLHLAKAENAKLREVVDKLDKTADDVPMQTGMVVFSQAGTMVQVEMRAHAWQSCPLADPGEWYSTIEAAEKAAKEKKCQDQ